MTESTHYGIPTPSLSDPADITKIADAINDIDSIIAGIHYTGGNTIYDATITQTSDGNAVFNIEIPDVEGYTDLNGKIIAVYTGTYCGAWNNPQKVYINVNGLNNRIIRRSLPTNKTADYDTKNCFTDLFINSEINKYQVLYLYFKGSITVLLNPLSPARATEAITESTSDNSSYITPKHVTDYINTKTWNDNLSVEWNYQGTGEYGTSLPFNCTTPFRLFIPATSNNPEQTIFVAENAPITINAVHYYFETPRIGVYLKIHNGIVEVLTPDEELPEYVYLNPIDIQIKLGEPDMTLAPADIGNLLKSTSVLSQSAVKVSSIINDYGGTRNISAAEHISNTDNPHSVTKTQVGLGNVPNVSTNDQTPTFTEAPARANIASGEKLSIIMGKIKKFFTDLKAVAFSGSYNDLADKPALKTVATSGSYNDLTDKPTSMTPTSHASTGTTYGIGTASNYGHVKTSDSVTSTSSTSSGIAATPKAVKTAYDKAVEVGNKKIWYSSGVTIAGTDSTAFSSQNVNIKGNRSVAIAYGNSYDIVTEIDGDTSLLAACAASKIKGSTSAIIGGYAHNLDGLRALILGGWNNIAHDYNVVLGKSNKEPTATDYNSSSGDLLVVGNGTANTRSNALRVAASGDVYAGKTINGTGADYAELREWVDGNPENQDRCGLMVTLVGSKIRLAQPGDNLSRVGIISGNPCVIGNNYADAWHGKYKKDVFGRYETVPVHNDAEYEEVIVKDDEGNETTVTKLVKEAYDGYAYVLSDDYDLSLEADYISREERPEFDFMGTHGEIVTIDDGTCEADGYCVPGENGIATKGDNGFYVMERIDENHIRVFVR